MIIKNLYKIPTRELTLKVVTEATKHEKSK